MRLFLVIATCCCWIYANAADQVSHSSLPDPMSLQQALGLIDNTHPDLAIEKLGIERAEADLKFEQSQTALSITADARLRWVEQDSTREQIDPGHEDHRLALSLTKRLYDSGYSDHLETAASLDVDARTLDYMSAKDSHVIAVMQHFFDVILADLESARDTEHMSVMFVRLDRARDRHELGQLSDLELLEWQSRYQDSRQKAYESDGRARRSRAALALILNRPGQQPSQLAMPEFQLEGLQLPEVDELIQRVLSGNRNLLAQEKIIEASRSRVAAARVRYGPRVHGSIVRAEESRTTTSADKWRVGVELEVPLYDGGRSETALLKAQTELTQALFEQRKTEFQLRGLVRDLWEEVRVLRAEYDASKAFSEYRELSMDRSRSLYEMEVKTDLGFAMVDISKSRLRTATQRFRMVLALAKLNAMAGLPVTDWKALAINPKQGSEAM
ncbi:MAG: TolC family protein [Gammaproteobacteria bacterium]|nr:MAG: TolC family protein [Gammaproteobacteria bacterium]